MNWNDSELLATAFKRAHTSKKPVRHDIPAEIKDFLRGGGEITQVPPLHTVAQLKKLRITRSRKKIVGVL